MPSSEMGIVTVTYNSAEVLAPFLECVNGQQDADYCLIVVDNASTDRTTEIVRALAGSRTILIKNEDNLGFAEGSNQGIDYCRRNGIDWILLINNDTEFDSIFFTSLLRAAARLQARVLVPRIAYHARPDLTWFAGGHFSWWRGFQGRHQGEGAPRQEHESARIVTFASGCCMLVHRSVFDSIGTFDPAYFVYWEDADFCWRLKRHGIAVYYDPSIELTHKVSSLTRGPQAPFSVRYYSRNQIYFLRKHFSRPVVWINVALIRLKNRVRRWLNLDDAASATLRRAAISEGLRMQPHQRR